MSLLFSLLAFALILSPVVFIHELGHYLMARAFGVQVEVFSVGFGPSLWSYKSQKTGTLWKIGLVPLGGYAKFSGDENAASSIHAVVEHKDPNSPLITHKAPWQVALIGFAGPLANYILAFILMFGVFTFLGTPVHDASLEVSPHSLAYTSGLRTGDRVLAFDEYKIEKFQDIVEHLRHKPKSEEISLIVEEKPHLPVNVEKNQDPSSLKKESSLKHIVIKSDKLSRQESLNQEEVAKRVKDPRQWEEEQTSDQKNPSLPQESWLGSLGIEPLGTILSYDHQSPSEATKTIIGLMNPLKTFSNMGSMKDLKKFKGPIGILEKAGDVMSTNLSTILLFMASLSLGLGFFNLLPLPLLDGGRILMSSVEMIIGRSLSIKLQEILSLGSMILLGGFFLYVSWNDLMNLKMLQPLLSLLHLK